MSVESDAAAGRAQAEVEPAIPAANPVPLALMTFLPAGIGLGLWLVGYLDTTALPGGLIPLVTTCAGLFMMIAAIWAAREKANTVAAIFGVFSGFWISFGFMVMAFNNGWFIDAGTGQALSTAQVYNIQSTFLMSFAIVFIILTLATLRLPLMFTVGFVFVDITFVLVYLAVTFSLTGLLPIAGITTFIFDIVFAYIMFSEIGSDLGGKPLAMGSPVQK